jgi:arylsulfatase A-like enzyme
MQRRTFLSLPLAAAAAPAAPKQPNVIVLLADDLGSADLGCTGAEFDTPNLNKFATQGVRFERFHSFPVCSPTRSALMTGRSPMRLGVCYHVIRPWMPNHLPMEEHLLPQTFKAAGYQTAMAGKWHLGHARGAYWPHRRGFDRAYGHVNGAIDYFTHERDGGLDWHRNGEPLHEQGYTTDLIGAEAVRNIKNRDRAKPFFLYVPFNAPHAPLEAPPELLEKYAKRIPDKNRHIYAAMVERMDAACGRILATLDEERIAEETIVFFFSDNGGPTALGASNKPLRAGKGTVYQGGLRVPAIMRWPGRIQPGTRTSQTAAAFDIFPTLAAAAGVKPQSKLPFDGRNLWPTLSRGATEEREDLFFAVESQATQHHAVLHKDVKLVRDVPIGGGAPVNELYDLAADPLEKQDIAARQPQLVKELAAKIDAWRALYPKDGVHAINRPPAGWKAPASYTEYSRL